MSMWFNEFACLDTVDSFSMTLFPKDFKIISNK